MGIETHMNRVSSSNVLANAKMFRIIGYTLVFLMMLCVVMTIGSLIQNVLPQWHAGVIVGILLFMIVDRLYTYQNLKSLTPFSSEWLIALGTQWLVIAIVMRCLLSYANGLDAFRADLSLISRGYLETLFTPEYIISLLLMLLIWYQAGQFLVLLDEIGLDMQLALSADPGRMGLVPAHPRLVHLTFSLGIFLVILTALTRLHLDTALSSSSGFPHLEWKSFSGAEAGALLYFIFGLALLSLSRLMSLQTRWNDLRIPVSTQNLTRQWGLYSLIFLFVLAVIVSLLPSGNSFGFLSLLGALFDFLFLVLYFVLQVVLALIMLLFSLPFLLFGKMPPLMSRLPIVPALPRPPPLAPALSTPGSAIWALIRSILLWGSLIAILLFAFIHFVRQHDEILATLRKSRITNWLLLAWQWLYSNVDKARGGLSQIITEGWQSIVARLEGRQSLLRPGFISLRLLDPRRRVYFFYLAMVRRGGEQGLTRKPSQAPAEYATTLEKSLPSVSEDIHSITEAFVEARYSRREVERKQADRVKATWARIRQAFQNKAKRQ